MASHKGQKCRALSPMFDSWAGNRIVLCMAQQFASAPDVGDGCMEFGHYRFCHFGGHLY